MRQTDRNEEAFRATKPVPVLSGPALVAQLRSDIISGVYQPGEKLKFASLSKHYDSAYGTLREALMGLVAEGFVVSEANKGVQRCAGIRGRNSRSH